MYPSDMTKDEVRECVLRSFNSLLQFDGSLFDCPIEDDKNNPGQPRKLHEVCVNHRLANYLEEEFIPIDKNEEALFVDIEFNREGPNPKQLMIDGTNKNVRPDIIIHNRKSDSRKVNFLVVECKKYDASKTELDNDCKKIRALMDDQKYQYKFGLQVIYRKGEVCGTLFFKNGIGIDSERIS